MRRSGTRALGVGLWVLFALRPSAASAARASLPRWWIGAGPTAAGGARWALVF